jgi:hypothetical protein
MKRFTLCALTVWLCLGSTAWASLVRGGILATATNLNHFLVWCNSDGRGDFCTDSIKLTPPDSVKTANLAASGLASDLIEGHHGTLDDNNTDLSANLMTERFEHAIGKSDDQPDDRLTGGGDPPALAAVPEPASVAMVGVFLAFFAIARRRASH